MLARWAVLVALVSCVESSSVRCPDGTSCPDGTACASVDDETLCVLPDQIASCDGKLELDACGANLRCYDGVCLPAGCGNGRVDPDEACDDKNTVPNDGCSADCRSTETCGNGIVDAIKGEQCDDGPASHALSHDGCASDCTLEAASWVPVPLLSEMGEAALAYDVARDRLVLFGEPRSASETWEWDGSRWLLQSPRVSPVPRSNHAMAYDPVRKRVVLFGGGSFNDTWEWDGTTWTLRTPPISPPARNRHAMAFDPRRKRIVLFGGLDPQTVSPLDDTWAWDGDSWTRIASAEAPSARQRSAMAYDPVRDVIVLFGGFLANNTVDNETWELGTTGWIRRTPATVPPPRSSEALAFDPRSGQIVMHGGSGGGQRSDTWTWNGTDWTLYPFAGPSMSNPILATTVLRDGYVVAFDRGKTYRWDAGWTLVEDTTPAIQPRFAAAGAADVAGRRVLIHGGIEASTVQASLLFTGGWQRLANTAAGSSPGRIEGGALAYDTARREFVHFGGRNATTASDSQETWIFTTAWTQRTPAAPLPPPRFDHMLAYDAARARVVLFGGTGGLDDTWLWDGITWMLAQPATKPPPRQAAAIAYDPVREVVVMFGGVVGNVPLGDSWEWNGATWRQIVIPGPPPRSGAGLAWDAARRRLVLFGGISQSQSLNDLWEYDGTAWTQVPTLNTVKPRGSAVVVSALGEGGILVFGGSGESAASFNDLFWLRWENATPEELCHATDDDGDGLAGCADADCWRVCKPDCPPGAQTAALCGAGARGCGDGTCDRVTESCSTCAIDCACPPRCGDLTCDAGETAATCPGDCP